MKPARTGRFRGPSVALPLARRVLGAAGLDAASGRDRDLVITPAPASAAARTAGTGLGSGAAGPWCGHSHAGVWIVLQGRSICRKGTMPGDRPLPACRFAFA